MKQWKRHKLCDICLSITDGDHQAPPKADSGIPFVTIGNFDAYNSINFTNTMFTTTEYYEDLNENRKAQDGDILYSVVGTFGIPVLIKENKPFVFQRHIAILRPDNKLVLPSFLYYIMKSRKFYGVVDVLAIGCAQRTLSLTSLRNIDVELPSLTEQRRIADILSSLDAKIELNRRINDNLVKAYA